LVVVKTHDKGKRGDPVILVECLDALLYYPVPFRGLVWSELAICILANQTDAASFKAALDSNVVIWPRFDYPGHVGNKPLVSNRAPERSVSWIGMSYTCGHDARE